MGKIGKLFLMLAIAVVPWILAINILRTQTGGSYLYTKTIIEELANLNVSFSRTLGTIFESIAELKPLTSWNELFQWKGDLFKDIGVFFKGVVNALKILIDSVVGLGKLLINLPLDLMDFISSVTNFITKILGFDLNHNFQG